MKFDVKKKNAPPKKNKELLFHIVQRATAIVFNPQNKYGLVNKICLQISLNKMNANVANMYTHKV